MVGRALPIYVFVLVSVGLLTSCGSDGSGSISNPVSPSVVVAPPPPSPPLVPLPPVPTQPPITTTTALTQEAAQIGPCVNMGNHLEPPNEGDWGRALTDTDFADIAAKGFKTVRLPVRFSNHAAATAPYGIDPIFMNRVSRVVDLARASNLRVILDMHHYEELFTDPAGNAARFAGLWAQVAERFKDRDDMLWFELINEPNTRLTHANLLSVLEPALANVRATNPTRKVVIGGENWSGINSLASVPLPNDNNLIVTFHYYDPFNFTHQGADWITPRIALGQTYGSQTDADQLARDVQKVKDFMTLTGRPLFLGEYGVHDAISVAQRAPYYKAVTDAFKTARVDGCVWAYTNTFPFRNQATGVWYDDLLKAIGL